MGAAYAVWHNVLCHPRERDGTHDAMKGGFLGPEFSADQIRGWLDERGCVYEELSDEEWPGRIAALVADECVIGLFHGRMEFCPRALGNRSIIGDARSPKMQSVLNLKIKFRESFRPFAPSVLEERLGDYFDIDRPQPYMLFVAPVRPERCLSLQGDERELEIHQWVNRPRSDLPAITHVDFSARVQSVSAETSPRYHALLRAFEELTGCAVIINTSFNVRGEPIVCTPEDACRCFMRTEMDYLVLGNFLLSKADQEDSAETEDWSQGFQLD